MHTKCPAQNSHSEINDWPQDPRIMASVSSLHQIKIQPINCVWRGHLMHKNLCFSCVQLSSESLLCHAQMLGVLLSPSLRAVSGFPPHLWLNDYFQPNHLIHCSLAQAQTSTRAGTTIHSQHDRSCEWTLTGKGIVLGCKGHVTTAGPGRRVPMGTFHSVELENEFKSSFTSNFLIFKKKWGPEKSGLHI